MSKEVWELQITDNLSPEKHVNKIAGMIERIQIAATKMAPSLGDLPYEERFSRLKLPTFEKRRERGNLIAVYRASKTLEKKLTAKICLCGSAEIQEGTRRN